MTVNGKTISADDGKILCKGETASRTVILGEKDSPDNWLERDMTENELDILKHDLLNSAKETISTLKEQLSATDYKAIKYAEGWISEDDYAPVKALRQALRERINMLEQTITENA